MRIRLLMLLALAAAGRASAQTRDRIVSGVVFDSLSGEPVSNATLYIQGRRDEFTTDSYGRFKFQRLHVQDTLLVVRRIGYVPAHATIPAPTEASGLTVDMGAVRLKQVATRLDQIAVEVEEVNRYPHLNDFYRRKQANRAGLFITREEIARTAARTTSDVLRRNNKIDMDCPPGVVNGDQCVPRSRRGRQVVQMFRNASRSGARPPGLAENPDTTEITPSMDRCEMDVWVDGIRSTLKLDEIPVAWIAGIEIYTGLTQTPPAFGHGACGVVAIWTTGGS